MHLENQRYGQNQDQDMKIKNMVKIKTNCIKAIYMTSCIQLSFWRMKMTADVTIPVCQFMVKFEM
jgi:hypothetical protein